MCDVPERSAFSSRIYHVGSRTIYSQNERKKLARREFIIEKRSLEPKLVQKKLVEATGLLSQAPRVAGTAVREVIAESRHLLLVYVF